jgi:hypothetical protein
MQIRKSQTRLLAERMLLAFIGMLLVGSSSTYAQGNAPVPNAHGTLEVSGNKTPLDYAYAVPQGKEEMLVILSDKPLGTKDLKDVFERIHKADSDEVHLVEITLDKEKSPISVSVRHKAFKAIGGGGSTEDVYEPQEVDKSTVAGRFYRKSPGEFNGVKFTYDATAKATIWKEPPPTFSGAAAKNSPQGKVALAFLRAGHEGNVAAMRKLVTASSIADLDGPMGKDIIDMMKMGPDPRKLKLTRVDVDGETAEVTFEQKVKGGEETTKVGLRLENGEWKVTSK